MKMTDLHTIGRRMPYGVPDNFFEENRQALMKRMQQELASPTVLEMPEMPEAKSKVHPLLKLTRVLIVAAAAVVLIMAVESRLYHTPTTYLDVQQSFDSLNDDDQAYLLALYQDDDELYGSEY